MPVNPRSRVLSGARARAATSTQSKTALPRIRVSYGWWVPTAGDVSGDGDAEILVGVPCYDFGPSDEGRALLYHDNGGRGVEVRPQQRRAEVGPY